jgi:membrane-bound serine protease (ClpP class)
MNRKLTTARLVLAIVSTSLEEVAIYAIWRWLLPGFDIELPVTALIAIMVAWGVFSVTLFLVTTRILMKQKAAGPPTMLGSRGRVTSPLAKEGMVRIKGELWKAKSAGGDVGVGEEVKVVGEDGLQLVVRKTSRDRPKR